MPLNDRVGNTGQNDKKMKKPLYTGALKRAGNETRTRDPQLGKLMLYQLSYSRLRLLK